MIAYDINELTVNSYATIQSDKNDSWAPSITIHRSYTEAGEWTFKINYPSSSSSYEGIDAILKAQLHVAQVHDCVETMRDLMNRVDELEAAYQAHREAYRKAYELKQQEEAAKREADPMLGEIEAELVVARAVATAKSTGGTARVYLHTRGDRRCVTLKVTKTRGGAVQCNLGGSVTSRKMAIAVIAGYSCEVTWSEK